MPSVPDHLAMGVVETLDITLDRNLECAVGLMPEAMEGLADADPIGLELIPVYFLRLLVRAGRGFSLAPSPGTGAARISAFCMWPIKAGIPSASAISSTSPIPISG